MCKVKREQNVMNNIYRTSELHFTHLKFSAGVVNLLIVGRLEANSSPRSVYLESPTFRPSELVTVENVERLGLITDVWLVSWQRPPLFSEMNFELSLWVFLWFCVCDLTITIWISACLSAFMSWNLHVEVGELKCCRDSHWLGSKITGFMVNNRKHSVVII